VVAAIDALPFAQHVRACSRFADRRVIPVVRKYKHAAGCDLTLEQIKEGLLDGDLSKKIVEHDDT
jgi:hypothetical protein